MHIQGGPAVCTWEDCGLLQLTGTSTVVELEPEEVDEVLRVTAMARVFPSRPPEPCSPSNRRPITGVCGGGDETARAGVLWRR